MAVADPAAEYGQIVTRDDFFRVLTDASAFANERLAASAAAGAEDAAYATVVEQLAAMQGWTAEGRTPSEEERGRVCIGLIALRELEGSSDDEVTQFSQWLHELNSYFEDWPS